MGRVNLPVGTPKCVVDYYRNAEALERYKIREEKQRIAELEFEKSKLELEDLRNKIEQMTTLHLQVRDPVNWSDLLDASAPEKPIRHNLLQLIAEDDLESYKPNILEKIFPYLLKKKKIKLTQKIESAVKQDIEHYDFLSEVYETLYKGWQKHKRLAKGIFAYDVEVYHEILEYLNAFQDLESFGFELKAEIVKNNVAIVELDIISPGIDLLPVEELRILKSGTLSKRKMTKTKYYKIYQDFICGCSLRAAGNMFNLLPVAVIVMTMKEDAKGFVGNQIILSTVFVRSVFERITFNENLDPIEYVNMFSKNMKFYKITGFRPVKKITFKDLSEGLQTISPQFPQIINKKTKNKKTAKNRGHRFFCAFNRQKTTERVERTRNKPSIFSIIAVAPPHPSHHVR